MYVYCSLSNSTQFHTSIPTLIQCAHLKSLCIKIDFHLSHLVRSVSVCVCFYVYEGQGRFMCSSLILINECTKTNAVTSASLPSKPNLGTVLIATGNLCQHNHNSVAFHLAFTHAHLQLFPSLWRTLL